MLRVSLHLAADLEAVLVCQRVCLGKADYALSNTHERIVDTLRGAVTVVAELPGHVVHTDLAPVLTQIAQHTEAIAAIRDVTGWH